MTIFLINCLLALSLLIGVRVLIWWLRGIPQRRREEEERQRRRAEFRAQSGRVRARIDKDAKFLDRHWGSE